MENTLNGSKCGANFLLSCAKPLFICLWYSYYIIIYRHIYILEAHYSLICPRKPGFPFISTTPKINVRYLSVATGRMYYSENSHEAHTEIIKVVIKRCSAMFAYPSSTIPTEPNVWKWFMLLRLCRPCVSAGNSFTNSARQANALRVLKRQKKAVFQIRFATEKSTNDGSVRLQCTLYYA